MRFINSLRNSVFALGGQMITILLGFVVRWFFVHNLGQDYLGVNSVMESVIMVLSMTELGIGTSVAFALYKPIDEGDERRVGSLMAFYRKVYHVIGIVSAVVGPMLIPFMHFFTREASDVPQLNLIYVLFLLNTVLSYFWAYKRTLLSAYQQHHINTVTDDLLGVIKYILQGVSIVFFRSFIGYLIVSLIFTCLANVIISVICDKKYPFLKKYYAEKLLPEDKAILKKSIVSLMYQKICAKIISATDNLMISYAKLTLMGIYSNYAMVVSIATRLVYNILHSVMGSVGNLMVQKDKEHKYNVFEEFAFANFGVYFFIAIGFSACLERFIELWAGADWLLSPLVTFVVVMNFFIMGMRQPNIVVIEVAGLFNKLRPKTVIEVIINLVVSWLFLIVFKMGVYGVLLGTTVSMVSVCIWWEIFAVHKYSLETSPKQYLINYAGYLCTAAIGCFLAYFINRIIPADGFLGLMLSGIAAVIIFVILVLGLYGRTRRFKALAGRFIRRR